MQDHFISACYQLQFHKQNSVMCVSLMLEVGFGLVSARRRQKEDAFCLISNSFKKANDTWSSGAPLLQSNGRFANIRLAIQPLLTELSGTGRRHGDEAADNIDVVAAKM